MTSYLHLRQRILGMTKGVIMKSINVMSVNNTGIHIDKKLKA
jgi:hypothetical protein